MPNHHIFIDFRRVYDRIKYTKLYEAMIELGIPPKLTSLIKMSMEDVCCTEQSLNSKSFGSDKSLRQRDVLACLLFNIALEKVIRDSDIQVTGTIFSKFVQLLGYSDDIDMVARSLNALAEAFQNLQSSIS